MPRKAKVLKAKAIRRLRAVQARILEEPRRINMSEGIIHRGRDGKPLLEDNRQSYANVVEWPPCNTVGCVAGHLCIQSRRRPVSWLDQAEYAAGLLGQFYGLTSSAWRLFHEERWPPGLRARLHKSRPGTPKYAEVVSDAIDAWIAGDGSFVDV